jgi:uncharacterized protein (DUF1330 family)
MPAYVIVEVRMKDHDQYLKEVVPVMDGARAEFHGRLLARTNEPATFAGMPPGGRMVLLEFSDTDTARRWWNSANVRAAMDKRDVVRINSVVALEGIVT